MADVPKSSKMNSAVISNGNKNFSENTGEQLDLLLAQ